MTLRQSNHLHNSNKCLRLAKSIAYSHICRGSKGMELQGTYELVKLFIHDIFYTLQCKSTNSLKVYVGQNINMIQQNTNQH